MQGPHVVLTLAHAGSPCLLNLCPCRVPMLFNTCPYRVPMLFNPCPCRVLMLFNPSPGRVPMYALTLAHAGSPCSFNLWQCMALYFSSYLLTAHTNWPFRSQYCCKVSRTYAPPPPPPCWLLLTPPTSPPLKFYQFCGGGMQPHTAPLHAVPGGTQHHAAPGDPP